MWKILQKSPLYCINFKENDKSYKFYVTDYMNIWHARLSQAEFITCLRECNFHLEDLSEHELIEKAREMLQNTDHLKKVEVSRVSEILLSVTMAMAYEYLLKLKLTFNKGSNSIFFQKVTQQLLKTVHRLQSSENELKQLLLKKDNEIDEYKSEGGEIVLRHLKTPRFDEEAHSSKYSAKKTDFLNVTEDFLQNGVFATEYDELENVHVKCEKIKTEPDTGIHEAKKEQEEIKREGERNKEAPLLVPGPTIANIKEEPRSIKVEPLEQCSPRKKRRGLNL